MSDSLYFMMCFNLVNHKTCGLVLFFFHLLHWKNRNKGNLMLYHRAFECVVTKYSWEILPEILQWLEKYILNILEVIQSKVFNKQFFTHFVFLFNPRSFCFITHMILNLELNTTGVKFFLLPTEKLGRDFMGYFHECYTNSSL